MGKKALCIELGQAPLEVQQVRSCQHVGLPPDFWNINTLLLNRDSCETDPNYLQLIPYVVLRDETGHIFCYTRGKGGDEERLHAAMSIGIGGHVDATPPAISGLYHWLRLEAEREIREEVGLVDVIPSDIHFHRLLVDPTNDVGRVHLGLLAVLQVERKELKLEKDVVLHGQWLKWDELPYSRLENWSKLAVHYLRHYA